VVTRRARRERSLSFVRLLAGVPSACGARESSAERKAIAPVPQDEALFIRMSREFSAERCRLSPDANRHSAGWRGAAIATTVAGKKGL
jgi:hypothetical protein